MADSVFICAAVPPPPLPQRNSSPAAAAMKSSHGDGTDYTGIDLDGIKLRQEGTDHNYYYNPPCRVRVTSAGHRGRVRARS